MGQSVEVGRCTSAKHSASHNWKYKCSKLEVIQVRDLSLLSQDGFSNLKSKSFAKGRRHCVADLTVFVPDGAREIEVVPEISWFFKLLSISMKFVNFQGR